MEHLGLFGDRLIISHSTSHQRKLRNEPSVQNHPRVILLTDSNAFAGTERHILDLAQSMKDLGCTVTIGCPADAILVKRADESSIPVLTAPRSNFFFFMTLKLIPLLRAREFEIVHAHNGVSHVAAAIAVSASKAGACVSTQHFVAPARLHRRGFKARLLSAVHSWASKRTANYVAVSNAVAKVCVDSGICTKENISVIPNGTVIPGPISLSVSEVRAKFRILQDADFIVSVSRLASEKSLDVLIRAMSSVVSRNANAKCVIAGSGPLEPELQNLIADLGLASCVLLAGHVEDPAALVNASDLFVLPGANEGFGLALLEAMMLGKTVIAANAGGPRELIEQGIDGYLFQPNSANDLANVICEKLAMVKSGFSTGRKAQEKCRELYSAEAMARKTLDMYSSVLAARGANK